MPRTCAAGMRRGCILFAAERATHVALEAIQALGGNGYINDYPAGRLLRDAKLYEIGAGTQEIRRMLIGRELFEACGMSVEFEPLAVEPTYRKVAALIGSASVAGRCARAIGCRPRPSSRASSASTARPCARRCASSRARTGRRRRGSKRMTVSRPEPGRSARA